MHTGRSLRSSWVFVLVAVLLVLGSGGFAVAQSLPNQPLQPLPTEDDGPPVIDQPIQIPLPTAVPARPPRVTPTPIPTMPPRRTPVPTTAPIDPQPTVAVQPTVPQPPLQPQPPGGGDTLPGTLPPLGVEPWLPGQHNRFEITLYTCPAGIDPGGDETAFLAACPLYTQNPPPDNIHFQMRDGDQTHVQSDSDGDSVYLFDNITIIPGPRFFIVEEFNPGYGDPAVFCGEGGNAHARIPTDYRAIRPELTTFSNVEYTCAWFKIPLQGDTVRVHDMLCPRNPGASAGFLWHWQNCQPSDAGSASTFVLTDASGDHADATVNGEASWSNIDFGAAGSVDLVRLVATGTLPYRVFCGDFNSGTLMTETNGAVTVAQSGDAPPVEYTCRWFRYLADSDFDDSIQIPATLNAQVYICPAGQNRDAGIDALILACTEPSPGVDVAMAYPGSSGILAIFPTAGSNPATAFFGLIGEGNAGATSEVPSGYAAPEVYCQLEIVQGWTNLGNGVNSSVALHFTWGQVSTCAWFHFPAE